MDIALVGIDCATADKAVGLAIGRSRAGRAQVDEVVCPGKRTAMEVVSVWLRQMKGPCLIAMDAPLGWPATIGGCLTNHRAGRAIDVDPNDLFRRATDKFIQRKLGKTPLAGC